MVATFHLNYLGHRTKYRNLEVGNTTQQLLSTSRPCCSIEFTESFLFWVILVTCNIGIYICIYISKVSYIHYYLLSSTVMFFLRYFEIWKNILWAQWVDCFIARFIKWCDISGCSYWIHFPSYQVFFSQKNYFRWSPCLLLIAESVSLDFTGKSIVGFFLKITAPSWIL